MPQSALKKHIKTLRQHRSRLEQVSVRELFDADNGRASRFSIEEDTLLFDYSKNRIDPDCMNELLALAKSADIENARIGLFTGDNANFTENRPALHTALRAKDKPEIFVNGEDIKPQINQMKLRLFEFSEIVRDGSYQLSGGPVRDVVNIGIGGSDLGPQMGVAALKPYHSGPRIHFVSNVDGADFHDKVTKLDPATTLFIIASKSFTTSETMANANLAKNWLTDKVPADDIGLHFIALSTNLEATAAFGIVKERTFGFWDWVGGRYSVWSAIGLSLMIAIGSKNYQQFLDGGRAADEHFQNCDMKENIPVLMALIGIWHRNVWGFPTHAILPYDNRLARFPAYLQQLDMESNGKHICSDGKLSKFATGPIIWGEPGTNGQHAFYQLLHQGTDIVPCDFLVAAKSHEKNQTQQRMLVANCFAQSKAMMLGRTLERVIGHLKRLDLSPQQIETLAPHKVFEGNRPSNTFLYQQLTPYVLGQLIAFYEHKIFVQGTIWGINSFDQWGVELGKQLANEIRPLLEEDNSGKPISTRGPSTNMLVKKFHQLSGNQK
ncbi:MAG: glucose-6-phosphate isomerase [Rhizobiaceae bacterium]|nr:glucose-6-phosphate isomerase [Rhizobiaceae bacterium]